MGCVWGKKDLSPPNVDNVHIEITSPIVPVFHTNTTINATRLLILNGSLQLVDSDTRAPTYRMIVFISSTFTDSQMERNYLMDELLFELR